MDQYIGKLLDNRYEILECVGTGGMAVVYKARCHRLNRLVAVKILKPELARDAEFRRRFHDESQAVAMLSHPNIVAVYDVSRSDDLEYIVMELIDGITLKQYMQKKGLPLNWREALHFITQIMKALSHAHSRGIIHRDIKPQNIMVLRDGSVKVADFGIARLASAAQSTLTQEALGSVHYISPEQARGSHIDTRADIYSAGVVLYEMTAGRLPYEGDTPVSVAIQHISSIPLPTRDLNPDIPEALENINMKAMASDADKRYVSADAMLADLEEFRKNPSINFEYSQEDLFQRDTTDEPTLVRSSAGMAVRARGESKTVRRRKQDDDEEYDYEDDYDDRRARSGMQSIIMAVVAILVFVVGIGCFLWFIFFGSMFNQSGEEYLVPNLVGMTMEEVYQDMAQGSINKVFTIVEGQSVVSNLPVGQIISQDPEADERKKGDNITITVDISAGPAEILMPNVVNKEYRQALALLRDQMGLKVETDYENSEEYTRNYVIRSEPMESVNLTPGQTVKIVISLGPVVKMTMVPDFKTQSIEWAMEKAEQLNLTVENVDEVADASNPKGTVLFQSIPADTEVPEGTEISFRISSGPTNDDNPTGDTPGPDDPLELEPPVSEQPVPDEQPVIAGSQTVSLDLSQYSQPVQIRVDVGNVTQYDSLVDPALGTFFKTVTGTGTQRVDIYVNGNLALSKTVNFNA